MYPNLYYLFQDLFGIEITALKLINSFGFFVALAFIAGAWVLTAELRRKEAAGLMSFTEEKILVGAPASIQELLVNALMGFLLGYKIIGAFTIKDALDDPQSFILSAQGNLPVGILLAVFFAGLKWWEKNKQKLAKPEERTIRIWPHDRVGDLVIYAALFGFLGAKIFHNLENWNEFAADPIGSLIAFSGLTFYGGLIVAGVFISWQAHKQKIGIIHLADAIAPALMLAYAVGRIGCHIAGDGDWGIVHAGANPYSWLPDHLWSYTYPHNVLGEGVPIAGCSGPYCNQLPQPVYPTPLYEVIACTFIFFILFALRKKLRLPGQMAGLYLIFNGMERFAIEKIRVNTKYEALPFQPTQAELISLALILFGLVLMYLAGEKRFTKKPA